MYRPISDIESFSKRFSQNSTIVKILIIIAFGILTLRLLDLQVANYSLLANKSENNRTRELRLSGLRGAILDRNDRVLVENIPSFELSIIPADSGDINHTLSILSQVITINEEDLLNKNRLHNNHKPLVIAENLSRDQVAFIVENQYDLPGVNVSVKPIRHYREGKFASHLLGYLGLIQDKQLQADNNINYSVNDLVGIFGAEKSFETLLRGKKGLKRVEVNATGRVVNTLGKIEPEVGNNISLTIDYETQKAAEEAFDSGGYIGAAVALDPNNGDLLAYISRPAFDPNIFSYGISKKTWNDLISNRFHPMHNRPISSQYPPGSTIKPILGLAALEANLISPKDKIFCKGHFKYGRKYFRCWKRSGHGYVNLHQAIVESCDVFFYTIGIKLGVNRIAEFASLFGLGKAVPFALSGSRAGLMPTMDWKYKALKEKWIAGETIPVSIGQGYMLTTPIQLAVATSIIANGGEIIKPRIIKKINGLYQDQHEKSNLNNKEVKLDKLISLESTSKLGSLENFAIIRNAMRGTAHDKRGTGGRVRLNNRAYQYGVKTGTSQVIRTRKDVNPDDVQFIHKDHSLFIAFAPFDDPKIAVAVIAEHAGNGGGAAADISRQIIDRYLRDFKATQHASTD
ncbi:MAG: penicillin-binding protein 2 [Nitrospinota bacterium]